LYKFSQKGMLNSLFCGSYSPELCDLESGNWMDDTGNPLVVLSSSCMTASSQQKVVEFLRKGGKVVLCPVIPEYDENFEPCTILKEFLGSPKLEINNKTNQRISFQTVKNVMSNEVNYITVQLPSNAEVIGEDENNKLPVSWKIETENKGIMIFLGIQWQHQMREHIRMLDEVLTDLGINKVIRCSNQNLFTSLRTNGEKTMLFVMNLYTSPMQGNIEVYSRDGKNVIKNVKVDLEPMKVQTVDIENYK
jgi:beta-galactosidase